MLGHGATVAPQFRCVRVHSWTTIILGVSAFCTEVRSGSPRFWKEMLHLGADLQPDKLHGSVQLICRQMLDEVATVVIHRAA